VARNFSLVFVFIFLSGTAWGVHPPPELCAVLLRSGVPLTQERIEAYFAPALKPLYDNVNPALRKKLEAAALAMGSYGSETPGKRRFAGENWGTEAVAHLWLLGLSQSEIQAVVRPLLETYYEERLLPGLTLLQQGKDFRSESEGLTIPKVDPDAVTVTRITNGRVVSGDVDFAKSILHTRDRASIDSAFAETVPGIIKYHFDGAMLAGDRPMAERILQYMLLLDKGDTETIYALEALNLPLELLLVGQQLVGEALQVFQEDPTHFHVHQRLWSAVQALMRVQDSQYKLQANELLLRIADSFSSPGFFDQLEAAGLTGNELTDAKYTYFDIALEALQGMGRIVGREYVDSVRVRLVHTHDYADAHVLQLGRAIADWYMRLDYRMSASQFEPVRSTLVALRLKDRLANYGEDLYQRRNQNLDDWFPTNVYWSSFEFFVAAGDNAKAARTLAALVREFEYVDRFSREDRRTLAPDEVENILEAAARIGDGATLRYLANIAEQRGWKDIVDKTAVLQSGESLAEPDPFPHVPDIPNGISVALRRQLEVKQELSRSVRNSTLDRSTSARAWRFLEAGNLDEASRLFIRNGDARGMEALGDRYLALHFASGSRGSGRHFGASAHGAYLIAATLNEIQP
jgi:hypothetical protein